LQLWKKEEFIERIEEIHKVTKEADLITHNIQSHNNIQLLIIFNVVGSTSGADLG